MVRFSLGEDSSDDDRAEIRKAPPRQLLKSDKPAPPRPPPCRLRQCALDLHRLREAEARARAEAKLTPFRARLAALGDAGASPRPERAFKALALAEKAALDVKALADGDIERDMARARAEAKRRHAASKARCEQLDAARSKLAAGAAARRALSNHAAWDDLDSLIALDGLSAEDRASIKRAQACAAAILEHLAAARAADTEGALKKARAGLAAQVAVLRQGRCGRLTEASAAGRAASGAMATLDAALQKLAAVKAAAPAFAPSPCPAPVPPAAPPAAAPLFGAAAAPAAPPSATPLFGAPAAAAAPPAAAPSLFGAPAAAVAPPAAAPAPTAPADAAPAAARAAAAGAEADTAAARITAAPALKLLARALKKKVGAAVNSVGNDCASALKCAATLSNLVNDPLGRATKAPANPFGAFAGGATGQPLHVAHGAALAQSGVDDTIVARFAAQLACARLLEKLTGETFDRRKDVWALAACVCEFVAKAPDDAARNFRRQLFQAKLVAASPAALSTPCEGADAAKAAALCAALCIVDTPSAAAHPFGGLSAAWCWLARAANASFADADAALPPLVAFLETAAPFLLKAYGRPAGELLAALGAVAAASKGGAVANLAAANIADLVDRARRGALAVPETFTTFTAPA